MPPNPLAGARDDFIEPKTGGLDYKRVIELVLAVIEESDPGLDRSRIGEFRCGTPYAEVMRQLSKDLGRPVIPTNRKSGVGVAMLVPDGSRDIVVLNSRLLDGLFGPDEALMRTTINTIHHELCHSHEHAVTARNLPNLEQERPASWHPNVFNLAMGTWTEYYATRRSFVTSSEDKSIQVTSLPVALFAACETAETSVTRARVDHDGLRLFGEIFSEIDHVMTLTAYEMATMKAAGRRLREAHPATRAAVQSSCLAKTWDRMESHLDGMYESHGRWSGVEVFEPLYMSVMSACEGLGLRLVRAGDAWRLIPT